MGGAQEDAYEMKRSITGGTSASLRRALVVLREAGLIGVYGSGERVVLECGHLAVTDAVYTRNGHYHSYCDKCEDWFVIIRRPTWNDILGEKKNSTGEVGELF